MHQKPGWGGILRKIDGNERMKSQSEVLPDALRIICREGVGIAICAPAVTPISHDSLSIDQEMIQGKFHGCPNLLKRIRKTECNCLKLFTPFVPSVFGLSPATSWTLLHALQ